MMRFGKVSGTDARNTYVSTCTGHFPPDEPAQARMKYRKGFIGKEGRTSPISGSLAVRRGYVISLTILESQHF